MRAGNSVPPTMRSVGVIGAGQTVPDFHGLRPV